MTNESYHIDFGHEAVVIDIDDTVLDIRERRLELFKRHFPKVKNEDNEILNDPSLSVLKNQEKDAVRAFYDDFTNPDVVSKLPATDIQGAVDSLNALESSGIEVILLTARPESLRKVTLKDLKDIGLDWDDKKLIMNDSSKFYPTDKNSVESFKKNILNNLGQDSEIIAVIGNSASDITAAFAVKIPAILLCVPPILKPIENLELMDNVGYSYCESWNQTLVEIGTFRTGEKQLLKLRDSFTNAYTSWLRNLNHLCAIDVTVASVLAALSGAAILETELSWISRSLVLIPLVLSLIALVFAIRSFTSKYSSGSEASKSIVPKFMQAFAILFDLKDPLKKARKGDAIYEYKDLRKKDSITQARAHREFFYSRYEANNHRALMNLRMFEMRMLNYVRAYAEHLASTILVWAATALVIWVILVSLFDPAVGFKATNSNDINNESYFDSTEQNFIPSFDSSNVLKFNDTKDDSLRLDTTELEN